MSTERTARSRRYRVTRAAIRYPGPDGAERVAEPGQVVSDLPAASVAWLLEQGYVELAGRQLEE